jgi:hypothetical protein
MKKIIFILVLLLSIGMSAQESTVPSTDNIETVIKSGVTYELHTGTRGGKYIIRTAKVSGNVYKQYLNEEQIAKLRLAAKI